MALLEFESPGRLARSLVTVPATLPRLHFIEDYPVKCIKKYIFMLSLREKFDCSVRALCLAHFLSDHYSKHLLQTTNSEFH
jgi:hypothetical protein